MSPGRTADRILTLIGRPLATPDTPTSPGTADAAFGPTLRSSTAGVAARNASDCPGARRTVSRWLSVGVAGIVLLDVGAAAWSAPSTTSQPSSGRRCRRRGADARTVDLADVASRHLHPRDVGGALVSIDQPVPSGAWRWGGPWTAHAETGTVTGIAGLDIAADDPAAMRARWADLRIDHAVRFVPAGPRGEGIDAMDVVAADRSRAGEAATIGGVEIRLV